MSSFTNSKKRQLPSKIEEGMLVIINVPSLANNTSPCLAKIVNVKSIFNHDYSFNLINNSTGTYILSDTGKPKVWLWNSSINSNTFLLPFEEEFKNCPICGRFYQETNLSICKKCMKEETKNFFLNNVKIGDEPFQLDDEQLDAIISNKNSIVTARAGSGKTRVLTAKLIDLLFNKGLDQDEVIAFCFNRDAANEIKNRLNVDCTINGQKSTTEINIVNTFHAFAKNVLGQDCGPILVDDTRHDRTNLIKQIILNLRLNNKTFENILKEYFLENTLKIDHKSFNTIKDYYLFVKNCRYRTLNDERVKSIPEKIIADFLFCHDINYQYERHFYLNNIDLCDLSSEEIDSFNSVKKKSETVPDFYLIDYNYIWEHWEITGNETETQKDDFSKEIGDYNTYKNTMDWKRNFWNNWRHQITTTQSFKSIKKLIETNPNDFNFDNKTSIENHLKKLLESNGILCKRLSENEIMKRVWKKAQDYFTKQIVQFIDKFQQIYMNDHDGFIKKATTVENDRERNFLRLGYMVYKEYIKVLSGETSEYSDYSKYKIDFNQCLYKAALKIRSGEYDHNINQLKWILIDEYQDFSELFHNLIKAILSRNPNITLFCVGDDWQAINRFAGSDLKFFLNFGSYFSDAERYNIGTNYRCEKHIVEKASKFMKLAGIGGTPQIGLLPSRGITCERPINDMFFESDINNYNWLFEKDGPWESNHNVSKRSVQAYIKFISEIINENIDKKIMILNRKSNFLGKELSEIEQILKSPKLCKIESPHIEVKTVHKAKGEEAEIVILTEVDENIFPVFHPDSNLFSVFGENLETIIEDEARLYYVALTRAKQTLYILYSKDTASCFTEGNHQRIRTKNLLQDLL